MLKNRLVIICIIISTFILTPLIGEKKSDPGIFAGYLQREEIGKIKEWIISFKYRNMVIEKKIDRNGNKETITRDKGYSNLELQLIDEIYFNLKHRNNLSIEKQLYPENNEKDMEKGYIKLHFLSLIEGNGSDHSVEITFYNQNEDLLARERLVFDDIGIHRMITVISDRCTNFIVTIIKRN